ncbi:tetratricopeptide repeat protein [Aurantiacibacter sp. MUD61]|uniref:tetratricopeptide repeat protein n=1 Tax=Aurantiacibacter sp. MUD61 TaxID=3009083 RepID=UPI0022F09FD1|nr:tetratricopeptide repeat protein [Aurantiacibacter sp. MUD61]
MKLTFLTFLAALAVQDASIADQARVLMEEGREAEAFEMISEGAEDGDPGSIEYLGWFYDNGRGVEQNTQRAVRLYRRAAELGQPHAQWRLGVMMDTGECECGSPEEAFALFEEAAAQGWSNAIISLGVMHSTGRGTPVDYAAAREQFEAGARAGNVHGLNEIGVMYVNGEGVEVDLEEAVAWLLLAMVNGSERAEFLLNTNLANVDVDMTKAVERANQIATEFGYPANLRAGS